MKLSMKWLLTLGTTALIAFSSSAQAQFNKPEDAWRYRDAAFKVMATHFGRIGAMVQEKVPFNAATAQANMAVVEMMSKLPWDAFPEGSDVSGSKAKHEIWVEKDKFSAAREKFQGEIVKLSAAVKTGDLAQIKTAFGGTGGSCKACHDNFKSK